MAKKAAPTDTAVSAVKQRGAERTMLDILTVATEEFANYGLSGARVDAISTRLAGS